QLDEDLRLRLLGFLLVLVVVVLLRLLIYNLVLVSFGLRRPLRSRRREFRELLGRAASGEPIADVALLGQPRQVENLDRRGDAVARRGDLENVAAAGSVVVGDQDDMPTAENLTDRLGVKSMPLTGTTGVSGREHVELAQVVAVLLALGDVDGPVF